MLTRLGDSQQSLTGLEAVLDLRYVQIGSTAFDTRYVLKTGDTMTGPLIITPATDSVSALLITNHANTANVFDVDTTNKRVGIGTNAPGFSFHLVSVDNNPLWIESNDSNSMGFVMQSTGTGGHAFKFFSTASGNGSGAGQFGIFDITAGKTFLSLDSGGGNISIIAGASYGWVSDGSFAGPSLDTGISRVGAGIVALGNGSASNESGTLYLTTLGIGYGVYIQVSHGSSWPSGTHNLIGVSFTSTDQVDIFTPGSARSTSALTLRADGLVYTNTDILLGAAVTPSGNGALQTKIGSSTSPAKVGGVIFDHFADAGNTTTGETDLYSDTTVANTLAANGDKITAEYAGIFVASGTATRDIRAYFAGTSIFDSTGLTTATAEAWNLKITIIRESATVIRSIVTFIATTAVGASVNTDVQYNRITGLTLTGTNILKITGQAGGVGAATNDIVAKLGTILFMPGA